MCLCFVFIFGEVAAVGPSGLFPCATLRLVGAHHSKSRSAAGLPQTPERIFPRQPRRVLRIHSPVLPTPSPLTHAANLPFDGRVSCRLAQLPRFLAGEPSLLEEFNEWRRQADKGQGKAAPTPGRRPSSTSDSPDQKLLYSFLVKVEGWSLVSDHDGRVKGPGEGSVPIEEGEVRHLRVATTAVRVVGAHTFLPRWLFEAG